MEKKKPNTNRVLASVLKNLQNELQVTVPNCEALKKIKTIIEREKDRYK